MLTNGGAIVQALFPEIPWHKKENILENTGRVEYGELLQESTLKGTNKTVGDKEHSEITRLYIEENLGIIHNAEKGFVKSMAMQQWIVSDQFRYILTSANLLVQEYLNI